MEITSAITTGINPEFIRLEFPIRFDDRAPMMPIPSRRIISPHAMHQMTSMVMATPLPMLRPAVEGRVPFFFELMPVAYVIHPAITSSRYSG